MQADEDMTTHTNSRAPRWRRIAAAALLAGLAPWASAGLFDRASDTFLPADQAFVPQAVATEDAIVVSWQIADGYYLYRHALSFAPAPGSALRLGNAEIPPGAVHRDEFFGEVETYRQRLTVTVPVDHWPQAGPVRIVVSYQGCADAGLCYPPQRQTVTTIGGAATPSGHR